MKRIRQERRSPRPSLRLQLAVVLAVVVAAASANGAGAITHGQPDHDERYPFVGTIVADWRAQGTFNQFCTGTLIAADLFLTASHCTVALEAIARERPLRVFVTFDRVVDPADRDGWTRVELVTNPYYNGFSGPDGSADPGDIAVAVLAKPSSIGPAALAPEGLVDHLHRTGELRSRRFTAVGYGTVRDSTRGGFDGIGGNQERRVVEQSALSRDRAWLTLSMVQETGNGGTCYGDSGGPHFLGNLQEAAAAPLIVSVTVTGDPQCKATDKTYRIDAPRAQAFFAYLAEKGIFTR